MSEKKLRRKFGIVILLDALGAAEYSEEQIRQFLSARQDINEIIKYLSGPDSTKKLGDVGVFHTPDIFTFGDTVIITIPLQSKKYMDAHLFLFCMLMRRYIFHSIQEGILFRGSFSIGNYIADSYSNTVMGEAVSDAAAWYEQSNWMGLSSTPKTNTYLEKIVYEALGKDFLKNFRTTGLWYLTPYDVPIKNGASLKLYTINWASAFLDKGLLKFANELDSEHYYLKLFSKFSVPKGTEQKYFNTRKYFDFVIKNKVEGQVNQKKIKKVKHD